MACDSTHTTTSSPGANCSRSCTASIRSSLCRWPSPKLKPMSELQTNSASRTVRVSMSGELLTSTEYRPRPWLCMRPPAERLLVKISAHCGS